MKCLTDAEHGVFQEKVEESFAAIKGYYGYHMESYEDFLQRLLPKTFAERSPIIVNHKGNGIIHKLFLQNYTPHFPELETVDHRVEPLTSTETHARKISYLASVTVDIRHKLYHRVGGVDSKIYKLKEDILLTGYEILQIPAMDGTRISKEFWTPDPVVNERYAGTFVINSHRKTLIHQIFKRGNFPFGFKLKPPDRFQYCVEPWSMDNTKMRSQSIVRIKLSREKPGVTPCIMIQIPYIPELVPLTVLFRVFDVNSLTEMSSLITAGSHRMNPESKYKFVSFVKSILCACPGVKDPNCDSENASREDMLVWIAVSCHGATATGSSNTLQHRTRRNHIDSMTALCTNEVFPHLNGNPDPNVVACKKALFLAMSVRKLLRMALNLTHPDSLDSGAFKRSGTPGSILAFKIRQLMRTFSTKTSASILRCISNNKYVKIADILKGRTISREIRYCMSSGNFSVNHSKKSTQAGVCQVHNSMNKLSRISHMTTVNSPLNRDGKQASPRQLKSKYWGMFCAAHTPETKAMGLTRHWTAYTCISLGYSTELVSQLVLGLPGVSAISARSQRAVIGKQEQVIEDCVIVINGSLEARCTDPKDIFRRLTEMRRGRVIPNDIGFHFDENMNHLVIHAEQGQHTRPVVDLSVPAEKMSQILKDYGDKPYMLFERLMAAGCLVNCNKDEEDYMRIAVDINQLRDAPSGTYTHMEIEARMTIFGVVAASQPNLENNQGPRNIYACAMRTQAMSSQHRLFNRFQLDVQSHVLNYAQRSMVATKTEEILGLQTNECCGQSVIVAIVATDGYTQEDGIEMCRDSLDNGLFRSTRYHVTRDNEVSHGHDKEAFGTDGARGDVSALDADGLGIPGEKINRNKLIIGKVIEHSVAAQNSDGSVTSESRTSDASQFYKHISPGIIDRVILTTQKGIRSATTRTRTQHIPMIGDKLSSRHGQKGVITIIKRRENMIQVCTGRNEGMTPDIVVNVHGFPKRMTTGQNKGMAAATKALLMGKIYNGTAFKGETTRELVDTLKDMGELCMEQCINGETGKFIGPVCFGVSTYMALKQQAINKVHARCTGKRNTRTGQPVPGKNGGPRFGYMENSSVATSGASAVLRDRMLLSSDAVETYICECGEFASAPEPEFMSEFRLSQPKPSRCPMCKDSGKNKIGKVLVPSFLISLKRTLGGSIINMKFPVTVNDD